jgi:hypothetical protein
MSGSHLEAPLLESPEVLKPIQSDDAIRQLFVAFHVKV